MKEPRPALENLCCLNAQCNAYGQRGQANLRVRKIYGVDRIRYLRCGCCGEEFSERKGTALFNCKISEAQAVSVIEHLDSACGLNATARLVGVSKDAVRRLLRVGAGSAINCMIDWFVPYSRRPSNLMRNGRMWRKNNGTGRHRTTGAKPGITGCQQLGSAEQTAGIAGTWAPYDPHDSPSGGRRGRAAGSPSGAAGAVYRWRTDLSRSDCNDLWSSLSRAASRHPRPTTGSGDADPPSAGVCPDCQTSASRADPTGGSPTDLWQGQIGPSRGRLGLDESQHQRHRAVQPDRSDAQRTKSAQNPELFASDGSA